MPMVFFDILLVIVVRTELNVIRVMIWIIKLSIISTTYITLCLKDKSKERNINHQNTHQTAESSLTTSIDMASYLKFLKTPFN